MYWSDSCNHVMLHNTGLFYL